MKRMKGCSFLGGITLVFWMAAVAQARQSTAIGVGNPGPVSPDQGLLGTYYNCPLNAATPPGAAPGSPDPAPPQANCVQFLQRIDGPINADFVATPPPGVNAGSLHFIIVWTGFVDITTSGNYTFSVSCDDGERSWWGNATKTTPDLDHWVKRGLTKDTTAPAQMLAVGRIPVRIEYEQGTGAAKCQVYWNAGTGDALIPAAHLSPPDGPGPAKLTAVAPKNNPTPLVNLQWTPSATGVAATSWILSRAVVTGGKPGAYTQIAVQPGTTFADTTIQFGTTYSYLVQGTADSALLIGLPGDAARCTPVAPNLFVTPAALSVGELGGTATFTITANPAPAPPGTAITLTASVSGGAPYPVLLQTGANAPSNSISLSLSSATGLSETVTVIGQTDHLVTPNRQCQIVFSKVTCSDNTFTGDPVSPVQVTVVEGDVAGVIENPSSFSSTNGGPPFSFTVQLASQPAGNNTVSTTLSVSIPAEATVSPPTLTFTSADWSKPQTVTVTPLSVDPQTTYFTDYDIVLSNLVSGDPDFNNVPVAPVPVSVPTTVPPLKKVWSGCGLLGPEGLVVFGLLALSRRRRAAGARTPGS